MLGDLNCAFSLLRLDEIFLNQRDILIEALTPLNMLLKKKRQS